MTKMIRLGRLLVILATVVCLVTSSIFVSAPRPSAKGNPEETLSGISVHGTIQQVIDKYGSPDRVVKFNVANAPAGGGERHYLWTRGNTKMSVTTEYYVGKDGKEIESDTSAIEVIGDAPVDDIGKTGAGLSLGDTLEKAKKIYGVDFRKSQIYKTHFRGDHFPVQTLEWGKESANLTRLCLAFDKQGRINFITLAIMGE